MFEEARRVPETGQVNNNNNNIYLTATGFSPGGISDPLIAGLLMVCRGKWCFLICVSPINACPTLRQICVVRSASRGVTVGVELTKRLE
jgi:hypothetical protein